MKVIYRHRDDGTGWQESEMSSVSSQRVRERKGSEKEEVEEDERERAKRETE